MSVKDQEGAKVRVGDLVFYSGEVWKVVSITLRSNDECDLLNMKNTSGIRNGVSPKNVEALGRDTISGLGSNGALDKHPLLKFKVGDHVCTKPGKFRTGKVTAVTQDKVTFEVWEAGTCKEVTYKANAVERTGSVSVVGSSVGSGSFSLGEYDYYHSEEELEREMKREREQQKWWERYNGGHKSSREPRKPREPEKKDSISMGELIEEEAKRLSREAAPPKQGGEEGEEDKPKIKKRKGEW